WGEDAEGARGARDSRFAKAGVTLTRRAVRHGDGAEALYDALRISHGIVTSGSDFALQDAFPHDLLMDFNGGLSFRNTAGMAEPVALVIAQRYV
ncbi:folate-binding protein, partial [Rhizobium leguminosarum]